MHVVTGEAHQKSHCHDQQQTNDQNANCNVIGNGHGIVPSDSHYATLAWNPDLRLRHLEFDEEFRGVTASNERMID